MSHVLPPLFALLASSKSRDLARQVAYLREENRILRSRLPKQVSVTEKEGNRLVRAGRKLGIKLKELISIVTYGSFLRGRARLSRFRLRRKVQRGNPVDHEDVDNPEVRR